MATKLTASETQSAIWVFSVLEYDPFVLLNPARASLVPGNSLFVTGTREDGDSTRLAMWAANTFDAQELAHAHDPDGETVLWRAHPSYDADLYTAARLAKRALKDLPAASRNAPMNLMVAAEGGEYRPPGPPAYSRYTFWYHPRVELRPGNPFGAGWVEPETWMLVEGRGPGHDTTEWRGKSTTHLARESG